MTSRSAKIENVEVLVSGKRSDKVLTSKNGGTKLRLHVPLCYHRVGK